jgi:hypothetical protein
MRGPKKRAAKRADYQETKVLVFPCQGQFADCDLLKSSLRLSVSGNLVYTSTIASWVLKIVVEKAVGLVFQTKGSGRAQRTRGVLPCSSSFTSTASFAACKEVMCHHASHQQAQRCRQKNDEDELGDTKPR